MKAGFVYVPVCRVLCFCASVFVPLDVGSVWNVVWFEWDIFYNLFISYFANWKCMQFPVRKARLMSISGFRKKTYMFMRFFHICTKYHQVSVEKARWKLVSVISVRIEKEKTLPGWCHLWPNDYYQPIVWHVCWLNSRTHGQSAVIPLKSLPSMNLWCCLLQIGTHLYSVVNVISNWCFNLIT